MVVVPAVGLGVVAIGIVSFAVGYVLLGAILKQNNNNNPKDIEAISISAGISFAIITFVVLYYIVKDKPSETWELLTIVGIIAGLSTWIIAAGRSGPSPSKNNDWTDGRQDKRTEYDDEQKENKKRIDKLFKDRQKAEKEREKAQSDYCKRINTRRREIISLFRNQKNAFLFLRQKGIHADEGGLLILSNILNDLFPAYNLPIRERIEPIHSPEGTGIKTAEGVLEVNDIPLLVMLTWGNKPIGPADASPLLVRVYGRELPGLLIISNTIILPSAKTICNQAKKDKKIVLLYFIELIKMFEKNGNIKQYLQMKIEGK